MSNVIALSLEDDLIQRNALAQIIGTSFNAVQNGVQTAMCSDCCSSNGNDCDPRDQYRQ